MKTIYHAGRKITKADGRSLWIVNTDSGRRFGFVTEYAAKKKAEEISQNQAF